MSRTKSQVSIEFIAIFFIFLLFTSAVILMYIVKNQEISIKRASLEAQSLLDDVVMTINTAVIRGDGFSMELELPEKIYGSDYTLFINGSWVYLSATAYNMTIFKSIFTGNVTGSLVPGENIIRNVREVIFIE